MSLTTRMLAPIALIMSIALAFVAGSAYDNAKKIVSSNIVTIEATVVEAVSREIAFMLESTRNYMRSSATAADTSSNRPMVLTQKKTDRSAPEQKIFLEQINQSVAIYITWTPLFFSTNRGRSRPPRKTWAKGRIAPTGSTTVRPCSAKVPCRDRSSRVPKGITPFSSANPSL